MASRPSSSRRRRKAFRPKRLAALDDVHYDQSVINADRRQSVFSQSFLEFSDRMVARYRMTQGKQLSPKTRSTFARIEQEFGVPGPVLVAFWGLETDFGANLGKFPTLQSLATLAYDCRRPDMFRAELIAALKILDRGDLDAAGDGRRRGPARSARCSSCRPTI